MKTESLPLPLIFVRNRQRKVAVDRNGLEEFARWALPWAARERGPGLTTLDEIHVLLISDRRIAELHKRFMHIPGPTDVITFQHGEIFISVETARREAKAQGTSLARELQLYLLHGLLHLQGLDDCEPAARARMQAAQKKILAQQPAWTSAALSALELTLDRPEVFPCLRKTLKELRCWRNQRNAEAPPKPVRRRRRKRR